MKMSHLVVYLFVNQSLGMDKGKIAAQTNHAVNKLHRNIGEQHPKVRKIFTEYMYGDCIPVCIAYKSTLSQMEYILETYGGEIITDAGLTQVPEGSKTVLALYPRVRCDEFSTFKLL